MLGCWPKDSENGDFPIVMRSSGRNLQEQRHQTRRHYSMRRILGAVIRLLTPTAALFLFSYLSVVLVLAFQIQRASRLLEEVRSVNVGDGENSLRPILERFGGSRWDVQLGSHEDYNYVLEVNPWSFPIVSSDASRRRVQAIERVLTPRFRRAIGIREWVLESDIAIKQHRVVAVQTLTIVEGRPMWLGASWRLSEKPREFDRNADSFDQADPTTEGSRDLATSGILNMESGAGTIWSIWTTPSSPKVQSHMANQVNFGCLRSFSGCDSVCDLLPEAARFFTENPNLGLKGGGWDESSRTCIKHDLRENHYW
jgi:hypothetical protein